LELDDWEFQPDKGAVFEPDEDAIVERDIPAEIFGEGVGRPSVVK
jgi:hypothetical protein